MVAGSETWRTRPEDSGRWLGDPDVGHGEGAFWDARRECLRYVDMLRGDVVSLHGDGAVRSRFGGVAALVRPRRSGGYIVATEGGFVLTDDELTPEREIVVFESVTARMNEGACDAAGRLYCGSMAYDYEPGAGTLYRLDPDLSVHIALDEVTIPNGLVWIAGNTIALHADTAEDAIFAYEFDPATGEFGSREVFVDFAGLPGSPDGMALDAEGGIWVAMWGGRAVRRFDAEGALSDVVPLSVTNPTSCAIGGPTGTTLYVTTSREGLEGRIEPHASRVHAVDIGIGAAPVHAFGA